MSEQKIHLGRIYDPSTAEDGFRVLVDRIWPRGVSKKEADLDEWAKDVAPSSELRTWYGHDPDKFAEFRRHYTAELAKPDHQAVVDRLRELAQSRTLTLLTATKDVAHSHAAVLVQLLSAAD